MIGRKGIALGVAIAVLIQFPAHSEQIGSWEASEYVDRFTDVKERAFSLAAVTIDAPRKFHDLKVTLVLSCPHVDMSDGKPPVKFIQGNIYFSPRLNFYRTSLSYRFDKQKSESTYDGYPRTSVSLQKINLTKFLTALTKSKRLLIRVWSEGTGSIEAEFNLDGSDVVVKRYYTACGPIG